MTKQDKVWRLVTRSSGASIEEIDKVTGGRDRTYQMVSNLRSRRGVIVREGDTYLASESKEIATPSQLASLDLTQTLMKKTIRKALALPPQDRADAMDMAKKSIFYALSTAALIKANEVIQQIQEEM